MKADRPMNEYESALYEAVRVLGLAVIEKGGNQNAIQAGLEEMADEMETHGSQNGAATLRMLCRSLLNPDIAYVPKKSN
jgi:hypothetical protein